MKYSVADQPYPLSSKQHERKLQELRHERKAELEHLDGLKKALQSKLDGDPDNSLQVA